VRQRGEDGQLVPLLFGDVVTKEVLVLVEPDLLEMRVIDNHVPGSRLGQRLGQVRLPDAFRQPQPGRFRAEQAADGLGQLPDLAYLVRVRQRRQDRLIVAASQNLNLAALYQRPDALQKAGVVLRQPFQQAAGKMQPDVDSRMALQQLDQGLVG